MRDTEMNSDVTVRAHGASDAVKAPAGVTWIWFDLDDTLYDFAALTAFSVAWSSGPKSITATTPLSGNSTTPP